MRYKILYDDKLGLKCKKSYINKYIITGFVAVIITLYIIVGGLNNFRSFEGSKKALNGIVSDVKEGEGLIDAIHTFCKDMIDEQDIQQ